MIIIDRMSVAITTAPQAAKKKKKKKKKKITLRCNRSVKPAPGVCGVSNRLLVWPL